jgi:hypothetical protein
MRGPWKFLWSLQPLQPYAYYAHTNVSLVFTEIIFDEAGRYRFRADNIRRNFKKHIYKL